MRFQQLYSGSEGNAYLVTASNGTKLLIECGVTWKKLVRALDHNLRSITACLITHPHQDHCKAVKDVMTAGIDCYASRETWEALNIEGRRSYRLLLDKKYELEGFHVRAYPSNHDLPGSLLFVIGCDNEKLLFATDTGYISQQFRFPFDIIAIEVSYDKDILQKRVDACTIDEELAKRLLTSHLDKDEAMRYLEGFCDLTKLRSLHLLHCSEGNLDKEKTVKEFYDWFFIEVVTI